MTTIRAIMATLILLAPSIIRGGDLVLQWPIDRPMQITGTFGEYRGIHYHHGIDISTDGKKGFAVLAADDGFVSEVMYQQWGIGYAVFIEHRGGYRTFYGHLDRFAPAVNSSPRMNAVSERMKNRRDFSVAFKKGELPVRKGEVIGYSGDSGIGLEHFHFELRDASNRYLNPFTHGLAVTDTTAPVISTVTVIPLDSASRVDGRYSPRSMRVNPDRDQAGRFVIAEKTPTIKGRIALTVTAHDTAGLRNPLAPYDIRCVINGREVRHLRYDSIERNRTHRIGLDYDDDESSFSRYVFQLHDRVSGQGVVTAQRDGESFDVEITCTDASGNAASLAFSLATASGPSAGPSPMRLNLRPQSSLKLESDDRLCRIEFARDAALYAEEVTMLRETAPPPVMKGMLARGSVYAGGPTNLCVDRPLVLSMPYTGDDVRRVAIYRVSRSGKSFGCAGTFYDENKKEFRVSLWRPGRFFLARDDAPPRVLCRQRVIRAGDILRIQVSDVGTGIDLATVAVAIDGKPAYWDYDPDRYCLEILEHNPVWGPGKHRIEVSLSDRAGNGSGLRTFTYTVK